MTATVGFSRTTLGKKAVMAVTGLILFGFVFIHMFGNLKLYQGEAKFDHYAEALRELLQRDTAVLDEHRHHGERLGPLERGGKGQAEEIEAVIDTGFDGAFSLPLADITALGLPWRRRGR